MTVRETLDCTGKFVLRVAFGCLMLTHGIPKVMKYSELSDSFPDPLGMGSQFSLLSAIGAEVGCSILLILGLGTRIATLPLAFTMIVALFMVHSGDPWKAKELSAVYLAVYAAIIFLGPGRFSLDQFLFRKKAGSDSTPDETE